ncbi:hypothetical protein [Paractinoplanes durhamensis]|uniref:Uncharacterized protein n=1 Tax=Paractinoplanes durhamensis TaxID=113563 RepID=A0ABQ3YWF0_9ACTN|nr:hypothetical protein [Actinoplanes durhamensis]GIE01867.1 hypothetical protein Adu01nite_32170 [Actinoplanes durhamensis]
MSTYALVTRASAETVADAVRAGKVGGYVVADPLGTIVLFDAPGRAYSSTDRLAKPARAVVARTMKTAVLLLCDEFVAEALVLSPAGELSLQWAAAWEPPAEPARYLADRQEWDAYCGEVAERYERAELGPALAMVRNDPVPGEERTPLPDLLRRVCAILGLPDNAVGRSLLDGEEPGLYEARRVDAEPPAGRWPRLFARA